VTDAGPARPGRGGARRRPGLRAFLPVAGLALTAACSGGGASADAPLVDAGRYPVATAPAQQVGSASAAHYQLVAAGDPVHVHVGAAHVLARMSGPAIDQRGAAPGTPPPISARGVLTVSLTSEQGTLDVPARSFLTLGERQDRISVHADHTAVHVAPGRPATLHLSTAFRAGHTTFTWQPQGKPLVTWDFVVELD